MCLCLSKAEYIKATAKINPDFIGSWMPEHGDAVVHTFEGEEGLTTIVCIDFDDSYSLVECAGILAHEAVHIWQSWCKYYGERHPGDEQEAYAIQNISQTLFSEFVDRSNFKITKGDTHDGDKLDRR